MFSRFTLIPGLLITLFTLSIQGQASDSVYMLSGIIYNSSFHPVVATHVINMDSYAGDVSDSLGIFRLPVRHGDTLLIRNIAYRDTLVAADMVYKQKYIMIRLTYYPLKEARIFKWGSSYDDFRKAIIEMPNQQTLGETMGLPRADPDHIPYDMDETLLKSTGFLISSPLSYLYHNYNKKAKSARKVYWLEKNRVKHEKFDAIISPESIADITGLSDDALAEFLAYLFQRMFCDFKCLEIQIYSEIYSHYEVYKQLTKED